MISTVLSAKADKVTSATSGNFTGLDANGNLTDSGKKASDFATANHNHDGVYQPAGSYAPASHTHTHSAITDLDDYIAEKIADFQAPVVEKEIVAALTASTTAPSTAEADDYYINTTTNNNKLYKYISGSWVEQTPSVDVIYVAKDTSIIYIWDGEKFSAQTEVGGVLYINSWADLNSYYTADLCKTLGYVSGSQIVYYTFIVDYNNSNLQYQYAANRDGYRFRKRRYGTWSVWESKRYASTDQLEYKADVISTYVISDDGEDSSEYLKPNLYVYQFPERESNLTINLYHLDFFEVEQYHLIIELAADISPTFPSDIQWVGGDPSFEGGKTYEIDIMSSYENNTLINCIGLCVEVEPLTSSE